MQAHQLFQSLTKLTAVPNTLDSSEWELISDFQQTRVATIVKNSNGEYLIGGNNVPFSKIPADQAERLITGKMPTRPTGQEAR